MIDRGRLRLQAQSLVPARVQRMLVWLQDGDLLTLDRLRLDALDELSRWSELRVTRVAAVETDGCTIAGFYRGEAVPPLIGIVAGTGHRRASFTALHELGHHLQITIPELVDELVLQDDGGRLLEELTCDAFAAAVLLPTSLVASHLGGGTPTVSQITDLWRASTASRAAVCVSAAQRLASPGYVMLLEADGALNFASAHSTYPLAPRSDQADSGIAQAVERSHSGIPIARRGVRFRYRSGAATDELYVQAARLDGFILAVAVTDSAPWESLALSAAPTFPSGLWFNCPVCDHYERRPVAPCVSCGAEKCPDCGACNCVSHLEERTCTSCFLVKPAHLFDGASTVCSECA